MPHRHDFRRFWPAAILAAFAAISVFYVYSKTSPHTEQPAGDSPALGSEAKDLTNPELRQRAAMITSTFENSTTELQYGYAENIKDGRGITAGRAGFTSGTGDLLKVVERYRKQKPSNLLARYIPALKTTKGGDTHGLDGLEAAWRKEADDPRFHAVQDEMTDELYFRPAYAFAMKYNVSTALGQAMIWDNCILTGCDDTGNSTRATLERTKAAMKQTAAKDEAAWLDEFLNQALAQMLDYGENGSLDDTSSRSRIAAWRSLLRAEKFDLRIPLTWRAYGDTCVIKADGTGGGACK